MPALSIQPPFPIFTDTDGQPLENGYVWIGTANLNPITNPVAVYWDAAFTQPASQPIRTINGYLSNAGTPARLYPNATDYSILAQDKKGSTVYSALNTETASNITAIGDITATSYNGGQLAGMRNRLINGKMQVQQRGAAALSAGANVYTADRWFYRATGAAPTAVTYAGFGGRVADALNITGNTGLTKLVVAQRIEARNCLSIYNAPNLTVSAAMRNLPSGSRTVTVNLYAANAVDNFSSKTLIATSTTSISNVLNTFSFLLSPSVLFFNTGYELEFDFGAVDASTTVGISVVQLEIGTVATPFEDRFYGTELALCQRYYFRRMAGGTSTTTFGCGVVSGPSYVGHIYSKLPVTMRATPTPGYFDVVIFDGSIAQGVTSLGINRCSPDTWGAEINTGGSSLITGRAALLNSNNAVSSYIDAACEL
jgi:hypothetical protein